MKKHTGASREMLLGSNKGLDYLVIAKRGVAAVGIKPLIGGDHKRGVTFLVRIRATLLPSASQPEKIKEHDWNEIYPEINWYAVDPKVRASCVLVVPTGSQFWEYDSLRAKADIAADTVIQFLSESLGGLSHGEQDSAQFLKDAWLEAVDQMEKILPLEFEETYEVPTVLYAHKLYESPSEAEKKPEKLLETKKFKVIEGGKGKPKEEIAAGGEDEEDSGDFDNVS